MGREREFGCGCMNVLFLSLSLSLSLCVCACVFISFHLISTSIYMSSHSIVTFILFHFILYLKNEMYIE